MTLTVEQQEAAVSKHYGLDNLMDLITAGLEKAGKDVRALKVDDLAGVDEFHTRGRAATTELAALADIQKDTKVLDVGCGLGGTARHFAATYGCSVTGIDLTKEYIDVGTKLNELVSLENKVTLKTASALELPFEDSSFDVVWTEHVQMNIEDKEKFYSEIARVLRPGGTFLFHDIFRGPKETEPVYPTPWAEVGSLSKVATVPDVQDIFKTCGLNLENWTDKSDESAGFFKKVLIKVSADGFPPVSIGLLMRETAKAKLENYCTNVEDGRLVVALGMAKKET